MQDMTISEVLRDPLIRQMLRADKVSLGDFATLLEDAASRRADSFSVMRPARPARMLTAMEARVN